MSIAEETGAAEIKGPDAALRVQITKTSSATRTISAEETVAMFTELVSRFDDEPSVKQSVPEPRADIVFLADFAFSFVLDSEAEPDPLMINYLLARAAAGEFVNDPKSMPHSCVVTHFVSKHVHNLKIVLGQNSRWITFTKSGVFIANVCGYPSAMVIVYAHLYPGTSEESARLEFKVQLERMQNSCNVGWIDAYHYFLPGTVFTYTSLGDYVFNVTLACLLPRPVSKRRVPCTSAPIMKPTRRAVFVFLAALLNRDVFCAEPDVPRRFALD